MIFDQTPSAKENFAPIKERAPAQFVQSVNILTTSCVISDILIGSLNVQTSKAHRFYTFYFIIFFYFFFTRHKFATK